MSELFKRSRGSSASDTGIYDESDLFKRSRGSTGKTKEPAPKKKPKKLDIAKLIAAARASARKPAYKDSKKWVPASDELKTALGVKETPSEPIHYPADVKPRGHRKYSLGEAARRNIAGHVEAVTNYPEHLKKVAEKEKEFQKKHGKDIERAKFAAETATSVPEPTPPRTFSVGGRLTGGTTKHSQVKDTSHTGIVDEIVRPERERIPQSPASQATEGPVKAVAGIAALTAAGVAVPTWVWAVLGAGNLANKAAHPKETLEKFKEKPVDETIFTLLDLAMLPPGVRALKNIKSVGVPESIKSLDLREFPGRYTPTERVPYAKPTDAVNRAGVRIKPKASESAPTIKTEKMHELWASDGPGRLGTVGDLLVDPKLRKHFADVLDLPVFIRPSLKTLGRTTVHKYKRIAGESAQKDAVYIELNPLAYEEVVLHEIIHAQRAVKGRSMEPAMRDVFEASANRGGAHFYGEPHSSPGSMNPRRPVRVEPMKEPQELWQMTLSEAIKKPGQNRIARSATHKVDVSRALNEGRFDVAVRYGVMSRARANEIITSAGLKAKRFTTADPSKGGFNQITQPDRFTPITTKTGKQGFAVVRTGDALELANKLKQSGIEYTIERHKTLIDGKLTAYSRIIPQDAKGYKKAIALMGREPKAPIKETRAAVEAPYELGQADIFETLPAEADLWEQVLLRVGPLRRGKLTEVERAGAHRWQKYEPDEIFNEIVPSKLQGTAKSGTTLDEAASILGFEDEASFVKALEDRMLLERNRTAPQGGGINMFEPSRERQIERASALVKARRAGEELEIGSSGEIIGVDVPFRSKPLSEVYGTKPVKDGSSLVTEPYGRQDTALSKLKRTVLKGDDLVRRDVIIDRLAKDFGLPARRGHISHPRALGVYKTADRVIRWKQGSVGTVAHEIGHDIIRHRRAFTVDELKGYQSELHPIASVGDKNEEGFAEFVHYYVTDPTIARQVAPNFYKAFESRMASADAPGLAALKDAQKMYAAWEAQSPTEKVLSNIGHKPTRTQRDLALDIETKMSDRFAPFMRIQEILDKTRGFTKGDDAAFAGERLYDMAMLSTGQTGKAEHFLKYGSFDAVTLEAKGKGLKPVLEPIWKNQKEFDAYLVSRTMVERYAKRAIPPDMPIHVHQQNIAALEAKYPHFKKSAPEYTDYMRSLAEYEVQAGLMKPEVLETINALYSEYAPLMRVLDDVFGSGGKRGGFVDVTGVTKRAKGSERAIISPTEAALTRTYRTIQAAEMNMVGQALVKATRKDRALRQLVEEMPMPFQGVRVDAKQIMKRAGELLPEEMQKEVADLIRAMDEGGLLDEFVTVFSPKTFLLGDNQFVVRTGGVPKVYQVNSPHLYEALKGMEEHSSWVTTSMLAKMTRTLRFGATVTLDFTSFNALLRDQYEALMNTKAGYVPYVDLVRGAKEVFKEGKYYQEFMRSGGAHGALMSLDREIAIKSLNELMGGKRIFAKGGIEGLKQLSELAESATRMGEFMKARHKGYSIREAGRMAQEVTLPFTKMGTLMREINSLAAFSNAKFRGWHKIAEQLHDRPLRMGLFMLSTTLTPTIALWLYRKTDEEYAKNYERTPKDIRRRYWVLPGNVRIFKPEPAQVFSNALEATLNAYDKEDPQAVVEYIRWLGEQVGEPIIPTGARPSIEVFANRNLYFDRPIVPRRLEALDAQLKVQDYTPESYKLASKAIGGKLSPLETEHMVRGHFGGLGHEIAKMPDYALAVAGKKEYEPGVSDVPFVRRFFGREPIGSGSQPVEDFYEALHQATKSYNSRREIEKNQGREAAVEYNAKHPEANRYKMLSKASRDLSGLRQMERAVKKSNLSNDEKKERIEALREKQTQIAESVLATIQGDR